MKLQDLKFWGRPTVTMGQLPELVKKAMQSRGGADPLVKQQINELFKKDPAKVMASIIRYQRTQYVKDMDEWNAAIFEAKSIDNPHRVRLTEFYKDIEKDPFIYGIVYNKRILKISNRKFKIYNQATGVVDDAKTKLLQKSWFNDYVKFMMQSRFWGHSLVYVQEMKNSRIEKLKLVYREHVVPEKHIVTKSLYDNTGMDYTQAPLSNFAISIGNDEDFGLYEKAAIHYILKKHSWKNWDEFSEIFGIPIRIAKTTSNDKTVLAEIENWLAEMGSAPYGIFPADAEMDIKEASQRDAFAVFQSKIEYANFELEVLFTGQNRVTMKGGSFAKEKAMDEEADEVTEDDKMFCFNNINETLIPFLNNLGYGYSEGDCFDWDDAIKQKPAERMDMFVKVKNMGFKLNPVQITREFGIEIMGEDEPAGADPKPPKSKEKKPSGSLAEMLAMHREIEASYFKTKLAA